MKIIYSPFYDNDPYLGDAPKEMGTTYVGNLGLLSQLQLRAGMHLEAKSDVEREADYLNAMQKHSTGKFFVAAANVDPIGVAGKLLQWRDALVMAGWDGNCNDPNATKIQALAEIEQDFNSIGNADCWKDVSDKYSKGAPLAGEVESIRVDTVKEELPHLIQKTLDAIQNTGVEVSYLSNNAAGTPWLDPTKIKYVEFDDLNDAYEWFAQIIKELPEGTVVVNRDNVRLNHTLYTWDQPQAHSSLKDSNPQLLQLFKLSMSIFSRPLNINNLVSYLMLPMSPIPGGLRRKLAKQLMAHGGFGDKVKRDDGKERDDWEEIIETFQFLGKNGNNSPQAIGIAKAKKMQFLSPIRTDYSHGISKSDITNYVKNLQDWVQGHWADDTLPAGIKAQLKELLTYLSSFQTALKPLPERIEYSQIEKLILQIYRPMNYSLQSAQAGSANIVNDVRAIAANAETLIWLDCQEDDIEKDPYDFLSATERQYLGEHNCSLPDFSKHLETCRNEKLLAMNRCKNIILVRSKYDGTTRLGEHPMVAEAKYEYKKTTEKELPPTDPSTIFPARSTTSVTKNIEKFQPVKALELDCIDYPGRKESNSSLDTLIQLPFNYLMEYVAKLPVPDDEQLNNLYITTGLVAHHFFEHVTKDALTKDPKRPLAIMESLVRSEFGERLEAAIDATGLIMRLPENSSSLEQFKTQLKKSILTLIEIMQVKDWTPVGCEMEFPGNATGPLMLNTIGDFGARIDYLAKDKEGNHVIIDFKWSYGKSYIEHLKNNTAIQLELYRQTVLKTYGKPVAGVAYYLMPACQLVTSDFAEIPNSRLICHIDKDNNNNLYLQIQNSYEFRMNEIRRGHIEEAEMMVVSDDPNGYYDNIKPKDLCPLNVDEKYVGRGKTREFDRAIKKSEQIFKQKKKQTFDDPNAEPSEKATTHPILKGRLK
jgi:hypothetical protein